MKLEKILKGVDIAEQTADTGMEIGELKYDSRQVQNGDVFVAITGYETDGHKYIGKAIELGASAIVLRTCARGRHFGAVHPRSIRLAARWHRWQPIILTIRRTA